MNLDMLKASAEDGLYMVMSQVAEFIPQFVGFLCIVFLGYILAIIIKKSVAFFSKKINLDRRISEFYLAGQNTNSSTKPKYSYGSLLSQFSFYAVFFIFIKTGFEIINLTSLSSVLGVMLSFTPNILVAVAIGLVTYFLAKTTKNLIISKLSNAEPYFSGIASLAAFILIMVVGFVFAASQLKLEMTLLVSIVQIFLLAIAVVLTISFGLGCRSIAKSLIAGMYLKTTFRNTNYVSVDGEVGRVISVGPLFTQISRPDGSDSLIPNESIVNTKISTYNNLKILGSDELFVNGLKKPLKTGSEGLQFN